MMDNINELLYMYRTGDEYAFRELVRFCRIQSEIGISYILQSVTEMAFFREDMIQEAYTAAVRALDMYREDKNAELYTFLMVIIRRKAYNAIRFYRKNRETLLDTVSLDGCSEIGSLMYDSVPQQYSMFDPEFYTAFQDARAKLLNSAPLFTVRELDAFRAYGKYETSDECAQELGCTRKTFNSRLCRVKKKMRYDILKMPVQKHNHD